MYPEERLVYGIFLQAIEDYAELKEKNITERRRGNCGCYSIKDIEAFFTGQWCATLLQLMGCNLSGVDILHKAQAKYCQGGAV